MMTARRELVFLFDVDNTLLDNDRLQSDLFRRIEREFGHKARDRYHAIFEELRDELGYADYLGALERYRLERLHDPRLLHVANWLVDYPFAARLYPGALDVIRRVKRWGQAAILSDGDAVFQPRKVAHSGLWRAFGGNVLIFIHKEKELAAVERFYPAKHYVMVDDKLRILQAIKDIWKERVTTVFPRQGHYARDKKNLATYRPADISIPRIGDLLNFKREAFEAATKTR
jgi:FMN phosphatase YigB (HAD superfamily)